MICELSSEGNALDRTSGVYRFRGRFVEPGRLYTIMLRIVRFRVLLDGRDAVR